ncbi:MAG: signal peptidase I [Nitrososphaerales archaeon]|nr:signal peptidase I [Nitrososphaerales archaeon]
MSAARNVAAVLLVIVLLAGSALFIYTYTRKVTGISMLPTLEQGDLVVVQQVPINQLAVGDIIVYDPPCSAEGTAVIHRVIIVAGNGFITKGDNNGLTDQGADIANGPVTQGCIEGKVVFVVPYIERLSELPYGINYLLAALIVIFVVYGELRSGRDGRRPEAAELGDT